MVLSCSVHGVAPRTWPIVLLQRAEKVFGRDVLIQRLGFLFALRTPHCMIITNRVETNHNKSTDCGIAPGTTWDSFDLFGGALCMRKAWEMISVAAEKLYGVKTQVNFGFNVSCFNVFVSTFETNSSRQCQII